VSLSGGIDSATILSLYAKQKKGKITAVTVGYEGESKYDEGVLASQIAKAQNCTHHIKKMLTSDVVKNFPKVVYYADEPIADLASSAIFEVSKEARSKGLKVLLSGLGGDELYWGYPWVRKQTQKNYASNGKRFHLFDTTKAWKIAKHILSFGFASQFRNAIDNKYLSVLLQPSKQKIAKEQTVRTSMIEVKDRWLIPNCVELNDRLSMANSVEMRSPLLSATLFEQAYSSKAILKGFALAHKATLKKAVADLFDKAFLEKGKKGFTPPVAKWLSAIIEAYKHLLIGGFLEKEKIFSPFFLKVVVRTGKIMAPLWHTIYMLLVLEIWGRMYVLGEEMESIKCYNKQHD
jgi:asparagine synthase (glutamine-hydrolysing)